jgi:hypothetical protein
MMGGGYPLGVALLEESDDRIHGERVVPVPMGHGNPFAQNPHTGYARFGADGDIRMPISTQIDGRYVDVNDPDFYTPPPAPYVERSLDQGSGTVKVYDHASQMEHHGSAGMDGRAFTHYPGHAHYLNHRRASFAMPPFGHEQWRDEYPLLSGTRGNPWEDECPNPHAWAPGTSDYLNHRRASQHGMSPFGFDAGAMTDAAKQVIIDAQQEAALAAAKARYVRSAYDQAVGNDRERPRPHFDPKAKAMSSGQLNHKAPPPNVQDLHGSGGHSNLHYTTGTRPAVHDTGAMTDLNNRRAQAGKLLL